MIREREHGVVLEHVVVGYGVSLEEVDEVERCGPLLEKHRPHPGGVVVVDADGAQDAAVGLSTAKSGVATVEQVSHEVFLRALDGGAEVAPALYIALYGLH